MAKKKGEPKPSAGVLVLYRILVATALGLALSLAGGTFYALMLRQEGPPENVEDSEPAPLPAGPAKGQTFTGLGQIRVITLPPNPATVVFSITFPYDPEDKAFSEELASKIKNLRSAASEYLGTFTVKELRPPLLDEGEIKTELLRRYNALLRLGQVKVLYFSDFIVIE